MIDKIKNLLYSTLDTKRNVVLEQRKELGANFCEICNRGPLQIYNDSRRSFLVLNEGKVICLACSQEKDSKESETIYIPGC